MTTTPPAVLGLTASLFLFSVLGACADHDVTLYVALDQEHSEQLVDKFETESGLSVRTRFDTEASKTVGLVSALFDERDNVQCDVFWNNELAHTVRLADEGLLQPYVSPNAKDIAARFKQEDGLWTGFAARARVFIVNRQVVTDPTEYPKSIWDLVDPKWKGRCAVARPLTGTTLTHFVALREHLGETEFNRFLDGLEANEVIFMQSNSATMRAVRDGDKNAAGEPIAFALTDTDDFHVAVGKGFPVACVFPDQGDGEMGTMLIPNSVAIIKDAPNFDAAKKLVDFILSAEVEAMLAASESAQIPLRASVPPPAADSILPLDSFRAMEWDASAVARSMDDLTSAFRDRYGK